MTSVLRPTRRKLALLLCVVLMGAAVAVGCGSDDSTNGDGAESSPDLVEDFRSTADELATGDSMQLTEVTEFDWDDVFFFAAGTKRSAVNEAVGLEVYQDDLDSRVGLFSENFLAVFTKDGAVVDQSTVPSSFSIADARLDAASATITKTERNGGDVISIVGDSG